MDRVLARGHGSEGGKISGALLNSKPSPGPFARGQAEKLSFSRPFARGKAEKTVRPWGLLSTELSFRTPPPLHSARANKTGKRCEQWSSENENSRAPLCTKQGRKESVFINWRSNSTNALHAARVRKLSENNGVVLSGVGSFRTPPPFHSGREEQLENTGDFWTQKICFTQLPLPLARAEILKNTGDCHRATNPCVMQGAGESNRTNRAIVH